MTMRSALSIAFASSALLAFAPSAHAGAIGLFGSAGVHESIAYYYQDGNPDLQGKDVQTRPNAGYGGELLIGDRDDRVIGVVRMYVLNDWPVQEPDLSGESKEFEYVYPAAHEQDIRKVGVATVGIQWGLWGDPSGFQLTGLTLIGSGFATLDNTEFFLMEPGIGVTYSIGPSLQAHANLTGAIRVRKSWAYGGDAYAGIRYMFD